MRFVFFFVFVLFVVCFCFFLFLFFFLFFFSFCFLFSFFLLFYPNLSFKKNGQTPLHFASRNGKEIASLLIEKGADIKAKDKVCVFFSFCFLFSFFSLFYPNLSFKKYGQTPLHFASEKGKEIASLLLEKGAYINAKNNVCVFFCFFFFVCLFLFLFLFSVNRAQEAPPPKPNR